MTFATSKEAQVSTLTPSTTTTSEDHKKHDDPFHSTYEGVFQRFNKVVSGSTLTSGSPASGNFRLNTEGKRSNQAKPGVGDSLDVENLLKKWREKRSDTNTTTPSTNNQTTPSNQLSTFSPSTTITSVTETPSTIKSDKNHPKSPNKWTQRANQMLQDMKSMANSALPENTAAHTPITINDDDQSGCGGGEEEREMVGAVVSNDDELKDLVRKAKVFRKSPQKDGGVVGGAGRQEMVRKSFTPEQIKSKKLNFDAYDVDDSEDNGGTERVVSEFDLKPSQSQSPNISGKSSVENGSDDDGDTQSLSLSLSTEFELSQCDSLRQSSAEGAKGDGESSELRKSGSGLPTVISSLSPQRLRKLYSPGSRNTSPGSESPSKVMKIIEMENTTKSMFEEVKHDDDQRQKEVDQVKSLNTVITETVTDCLAASISDKPRESREEIIKESHEGKTSPRLVESGESNGGNNPGNKKLVRGNLKITRPGQTQKLDSSEGLQPNRIRDPLASNSQERKKTLNEAELKEYHRLLDENRELDSNIQRLMMLERKYAQELQKVQFNLKMKAAQSLSQGNPYLNLQNRSYLSGYHQQQGNLYAMTS
mmetsp:Transcript_40418/g.46329  ORF Transcript_40418/g.46329 Transcript_40418/m.46329 type:complete len:592 (-) Transcript_40418:63-1838(-)